MTYVYIGIIGAVFITQIVVSISLIVATKRLRNTSETNNSIKKLQDLISQNMNDLEELVYKTSVAQLYIETQRFKGRVSEYYDSLEVIKGIMDDFPKFNREKLQKINKTVENKL